ncbi:hypothetical protein QTQ03_24260 [Micromonospora sp. WMMA1363]|uniref:hypothetical protein n=1 Tax=Micromonospora sp. WMMA1363 TaxID=3053985 RepID=UPI00259D1D2E|nr:hypothetical protein [Micromonospora sp. WMMA1363]MDM4722551.1 hypothetical protein [Micromonospora sp. WMMA1363]
MEDESVWARLGFDGQVSAATTVWRLLIRLDAEVLSQVLACWLRERAGPVVIGARRWRLVIAVDGKVARGARLPDGRQVHLALGVRHQHQDRARPGADHGEVE